MIEAGRTSGHSVGRSDHLTRRMATLMETTIQSLKLDLSEFVVLTEAATGPYVVTPVIAAMAGSPRVIALTRDSSYGSVEEVTRQTKQLAEYCGVSHRIEVRVERDPAWFQAADIVTNLGFVRPLDRATCRAIRPGRVVPLMCEAWEWRPQDLDVVACDEFGIQTFGTNEHHPKAPVFEYCGWLALKLVQEAGLEGHQTRALIIGRDKFAKVIAARLGAAGAQVEHALTFGEASQRPADAVIIADYHEPGFVIGPSGEIESAEFAARYGSATVIPFVGQVDVLGLAALGVRVFPAENPGSHRMVRTLAALGPRPVIELHAAGLKVGAMALQGATNAPGDFEGLAQPLSAASAAAPFFEK
ncbi:MAG: hypothetical protein ABI672_08785 [Vicinamibacteria bacterium]